MRSPTPLAILTAADDTVIPLRYFEGLKAGGPIREFVVTEHGGHCGFIQSWRMDCWAETRALELLRKT